MRLPRPRLQRPKLKGPQFQPPQVLSDLYRDLKERRLLPVVALLLVAIIAVPVAISASSGESAAVSGPAAEIVPVDAPEAQAAVLAENPGLRNYKRRLDALKAKNPFEQQFQTTGLGQTEVEGGISEATDNLGGGGAVTGGATGSVDTGSASGATVTGGGSAPADPVDTDSPATGKPEKKFFTYRVDIRYGVEGDVREERDVKALDFLSPVGVFLGASESGRKAFFFLSSDVVSVSGDGQCAPAPTDCEFLALQERKAEQLTYQPPDGSPPVAYALELVEIKQVLLK